MYSAPCFSAAATMTRTGAQALTRNSLYSAGSSSRPSFRTARLITCHSVLMSRTSSTSEIQREVTQAKGHMGSNQKSALFVIVSGTGFSFGSQTGSSHRGLPAAMAADGTVHQSGTATLSADLFRRPRARPSHSGGLTALDVVGDHGGRSLLSYHVLGDDHAGDVVAARQVEHHRQQDFLHDGAEAAGTGTAFQGLVGDQVQGLVLEDQFDAVELEHLLVLLHEGVLGRGEDLDQRGAVQVRDRGDDRQPADEFGDQAELQQVFGHDLAIGVRVVLDLVQRGAETDALAAGEGAGHDEQDVRGVDLDEFLVRVLASALRRNRGDRALEDLQQRLLHSLAGDVPGDGGVLALARNLVDFVDVDDALFGLLDVVVGGLDELEQDVLDVLAHVTGFGQGRGVGDGERDVQAPGKGLGQVGLAAARGADQQDVGLGDLDVVVVAALGQGTALGSVAGLDPLVVVVDGDGEGALSGLLADHVFLQEVENFAGLGQLKAAQVSYFGEFFFNDLVAEFNALVADVDAGPGNELADLLLALSAERTLQQIGALANPSHMGTP